MFKRLNSKGTSIVELVLLVLVIVLIVGVGYYVYSRRSSENSTNTNTVQPAQTQDTDAIQNEKDLEDANKELENTAIDEQLDTSDIDATLQ